MNTKENQKETEIIKFKHVIPHIGVKEITLFSPADKIYKWIHGSNEVTRLNKLRHLGSLSNSALPGVRHARWDYTCAMLYYANKLTLDGMKTSFSIKNIEFSSPIAALQCLSLLWNIGHLPGTFSAEKGLYRYLCNSNPENPAKQLPWPDYIDKSSELVQNASDLLLSRDYSAVSRVLAVIKMLTNYPGKKNYYRDFADSFAIPFFLETMDNEEYKSLQWVKINEGFKIIRHLSYLTLDSAYTGLAWTPNIPVLVSQTIEEKKGSLAGFVASISEILSPIEKLSFDLLYHSPSARKEASFVAERIFRYLSSHSDPKNEILRWMKCGLFNDLGMEREANNSKGIESVCELKLRSHFARQNERPVIIERELSEKGFTHPSVLIYKSWNSSVSIEPDELIVDVFTTEPYSSKDIGKVILWIMAKIDRLEASPQDTFSIYSKNDIEVLYLSLLKQIVRLKFSDFEFNVFPWRLQDFELFTETGFLPTKGSIWAADSRLSSSISKYILGGRKKRVAKQYQDQYEELRGLRKLATHLRAKIKNNKAPRQRYLILTSSIRFYKENKPVIEFDGGMIRISTHDGKIVWYGLETKNGKENPLNSLKKRADLLGIKGNVYPLDNHTAVIEISL